MKKIISLLLALAMTLVISMPASAASQQFRENEQIRLQKIQELAVLAGKAARSGNHALANSYEKEIMALNGEILTYSDFVSSVTAMTGISVASDTVDPPPDSDYVHFTKVTTPNYSYGGKSYDIITISAISWNDESGYLHDQGLIKTKSKCEYDLTKMVGSELLAKSTIGRVFSSILTFGEYFSAIGSDMSDYTTMDIDTNDGICMYTIDMMVNFQWIRPHGEGEYLLRVREALYNEIDYTTTVLSSLTRPNGKVDTYTETFTYSEPSSSDTFGDLDRVCRAYLNDKIAEYSEKNLDITIGNTSAVVRPLPLPPYMEII